MRIKFDTHESKIFIDVDHVDLVAADNPGALGDFLRKIENFLDYHGLNGEISVFNSVVEKREKITISVQKSLPESKIKTLASGFFSCLPKKKDDLDDRFSSG